MSNNLICEKLNIFVLNYFINMFNYLKKSFARKIARRFTKEYPSIIDSFDLGKYGKIEFANWSNPLVIPTEIDLSMVEFFNQFITDLYGFFFVDEIMFNKHCRNIVEIANCQFALIYFDNTIL